MKALIFVADKTKPNVEVDRFAKQLKVRDVVVNMFDTTSSEGSAKAQLYDVMGSPAIILTRDDGAPVASWRHSIPAPEEIGYQLGMV